MLQRLALNGSVLQFLGCATACGRPLCTCMYLQEVVVSYSLIEPPQKLTFTVKQRTVKVRRCLSSTSRACIMPPWKPDEFIATEAGVLHRPTGYE